MRALFVSHNLVGDGLYISQALRQWIKQHKYESIYILTLNDYVAPLYEGMVRDLLGEYCSSFRTIFNRGQCQEPIDFEHTFDVSKAFQVSDEKKMHISQAYADILGVTLPDPFPQCTKPIYIIDNSPFFQSLDTHDVEIDEALYEFIKQEPILISMFSASCRSRDPKRSHEGPTTMLPFIKWKPIVNLLRERFPDTPIRFLGSPTDMLPNGYAEGIVQPGEYMLGIPLNRLALIMKHSKMVVTVGNGMSHLAASQGAPAFVLYQRCLGPHYIMTWGNENLLDWMHMDPGTVNPREIYYRLSKVIEKMQSKE